jgi:hypothetical protein
MSRRNVFKSKLVWMSALTVFLLSAVPRGQAGDYTVKPGASPDVAAPRRPAPQAAACNLVQNGDFSTGLNIVSGSAGSMPPSAVSNWSSAFKSPQLSAGPGCGGNAGFVSMWGNQVVGEAVQQTLATPIVAGRTYRLSACVRWLNNSPTLPQYVRFRVRASNGPLPSYTTAATVIGVIGQTPSTPAPTGLGITSTNWTFVTLQNWTAPGNFNTITINPENALTTNDPNAVSWGQIDNVCLQDVRSPCAQLDPDFSLAATLPSGNSPTYQLTATSAPLPAGVGFAWIVEEIDLVTGNVVPNTTVINPSAWWATPTTNVFSGYNNTSALGNTANAGIFQQGHKYRITRGVWGPCNDWTPISKTVFLCNNCRTPEIRKVPSLRTNPNLRAQ